MTILLAVLIAAPLLAIERAFYLWVWYRPGQFKIFCKRPSFSHLANDPVRVLERCFYAFKLIQVSVFCGWMVGFSGGIPTPAASASVIALGAMLIVTGQLLNMSVFARLGRVGVFYGDRLGHNVAWQEGFPFSVIPHPQYAGTALSIWGLFLVMRYPNPDWIALPLLETVYYLFAMRFESGKRTD